MAVPAARLQQLLKLRSTVFQTQWNPTHERTGLKYLRSSLKGPAMMDYYPPRTPTMATLNREIPGFNVVDHLEEQRLKDVEARRKRGKGPPKKGQGRRSTMKKK